jgi:hypothetical protein
MHCPQCGQQQISDETRFCSRCGFLLTGVAEVVAHGGHVPATSSGLAGSKDSPKRRGLKQGLFLFLLVFLVAPLMGMLTLALNIEPFLVGVGAVVCVVGGILRMIYALMFEAGAPALPAANVVNVLPATENRGSLPPAPQQPASSYVAPGSWRDTNELQHQPGSVTDTTTKLLQKEDQ